MPYKHIIFDFDGVLVESNAIRLEGFRLLFQDYSISEINELLAFAKLNGGLSRFEKIRYFFEKIQKGQITKNEMIILSKKYSDFVKEKIIEAMPVKGALEFLCNYKNQYDFVIISGSEQQELQEICIARKINHFFSYVLGSPLSKEENFSLLLEKTGWKPEDIIFIGDSINDLEVAQTYGINLVLRDSGLLSLNASTMNHQSTIKDLFDLPLLLNN